MIKATELRIGNYLISSGRGINIVTGVMEGERAPMEIPINELSFMLILKFPHFLKDFDPIHLTPEILEKFGFEREYSSYTLKSDKHETIKITLNIAVFNNEPVHQFRYNKARIDVIKNIQYFHQIQNLYFALTGEELEIKDHNLTNSGLSFAQ